MTWVVGTPAPFGYGFGLSDIRVTLSDGSERDCLQKIYPVGRDIAAAFAGSVRIGFAMIETLARLLYSPDEPMGWDPTAVADWWPKDARSVFQKFPETERRLQSHIMLIAAHPNENCGDAPWARSYVYKFSSPNFEPVKAKGDEVLAIGSGNAFEPCRRTVEELSTNEEAMFNVWKGEQGVPGGMATMFGWQLTTILKRTRPKGISSHLHYCWVYRGRIVIKTNDHTTIGRWSRLDAGVGSPSDLSHMAPGTGKSTTIEPNEPGAERFMMPKIATSWKDLVEFLRAEGASAEGVITRPWQTSQKSYVLRE